MNPTHENITINELAGTVEQLANKVSENARRLVEMGLSDLAMVEFQRACVLYGAVATLALMDGWKE